MQDLRGIEEEDKGGNLGRQVYAMRACRFVELVSSWIEILVVRLSDYVEFSLGSMTEITTKIVTRKSLFGFLPPRLHILVTISGRSRPLRLVTINGFCCLLRLYR